MLSRNDTIMLWQQVDVDKALDLPAMFKEAGDADGKWWIVTKRTKTEVPVNVPLLEIPLRLIKKYAPLSKKLDPQAGVYKMPESEYRARKSRKLRRELQEFALSNGIPMMN